jgi:acetyl esterase/lipase
MNKAIPKAAILFLLLATSISASALPVRAQGVTNEILNVPYCSPGGVTETMNLYLPTTPGLHNLVVYVHGGAWVSGNDLEQWAGIMYPQLNALGIAFAAINYRLAPEYKFPAQIQDVSCSVRFLRAHAAQYDLTGTIGVYGDSAGGQLALLLGLTSGATQWGGDGQWSGFSSSVTSIVDWFGPTDLAQTKDFASGVETAIQETFGDTTTAWQNASPLNYVAANDPPTLIEHGIDDGDVNIVQSTELADALGHFGDTYAYIQVQNAGHDFVQVGPNPLNPPLTQLEQATVSWFVAYP